MRPALHAVWVRGLRTPAHWRYGVGIAAAVVASLARVAVNPLWGANFPFILFFPTTLFTALFAGLGPALAGIAICAVMTQVWVMPPIGSLRVSDPLDLVGLMVYVVADGVVAWIGAAHRTLIEQSARQTVELGDANRAKDDFLAILSHELRTPLTTIVAGLGVLRQIGPAERASRVRDVIERQADHLVRMVDDLLDMKRIVAGAVVLERQPCDLAEAVGGLLATLNEAGWFNGHILSADAESAWVNGDLMRLQQITTNLLGNAVKYTPAGGSIHVSVKRENDNVVLRVRDTGIGIGSDQLSQIFGLFVQGDHGLEHVRSGLGVGLAVVRLLVELHGGTVEASSDGPGKGSTFTVRLPSVPAPSR